MKNARRLTGGLLVASALVLGPTPAHAQSVITGLTGFYYPTPSWNQSLPCTTVATCPRFVVLSNFGSAAVLDRETGLVWERAPGDVNRDGVVDLSDNLNWADAKYYCANIFVGGRLGWRLPSFAELGSLVDPFPPADGPNLPAGHPFRNVQASSYWTATTESENPAHVWYVHFGPGIVDITAKATTAFVWCVRGGMNADRY